MSDFLESIDNMIARDSIAVTLMCLQIRGCTINNYDAAAQIIHDLVLDVIAQARAQADGRKAGNMTFDEAMLLARTEQASVTRPSWNIFRAVQQYKNEYGEYSELPLIDFTFDNWRGDQSGWSAPYEPSEEDRSARDWMVYQTPEENWVDIELLPSKSR